MGNGWIGCRRQLDYYLSVMRADRDADGKYLIRGLVSAFMGDQSENADVVVSGDAEYFVDGHPRNLAAGLASTSYGMAVKVY